MPAKNKMDKPRYQDYQADSIKEVEEENLKVRVMAGTYKGVKGPVAITNPSLILDVQLKPGGNFSQPV
jgi:redox-sensitive bicupin YhaK (pirin superfamily)